LNYQVACHGSLWRFWLRGTSADEHRKCDESLDGTFHLCHIFRHEAPAPATLHALKLWADPSALASLSSGVSGLCSCAVATIRYSLAISEEALDQLRSLPREWRKRIGERMNELQINLTGDVKKLAASEKKYRLRVGSYRVLFRLEGNQISVYAVKDRKEAYE
jgi:mRNA interferase RelE/StbE